MVAKPASEGKFAFWDTPLIPVLALHNNRQMLKTDYFNRGGAEKFGHGARTHYYFDRRECVLPECDSAKLIVDFRGYSFCPVCKTIYNAGVPPSSETVRNLTKSAKRYLKRIHGI
jgi:hypothetical protein